MKVFWFDVRNPFTKSNKLDRNSIIDNLSGGWFSFVGSSLWSCGNLRFGLWTTFKIIKDNTIATSALKTLSARIGRFWLEVTTLKGESVDIDKDPIAREVQLRADVFFRSPTIYDYVYDSLWQAWSSWKKYSIPSHVNLAQEAHLDAHVDVLDARSIRINSDIHGDPKSYTYHTQNWDTTFTPDQIVDQMVFKDFDRPLYWVSLFESVIVDAITDLQTAQRQLMFFKNNAMPNMIVMLDPNIVQTTDQLREVQRQWDEQYKWTANQHKALKTNTVKDVKVLEMSTKDMELLQQRRFADKKMWIAIWLDLRLLWDTVEWGWSGRWSLMASLIEMWNSKLEEYASIVEEWMKLEYDKFIWVVPYKFRLRNWLFTDVDAQKEIGMMEVDKWIMTRNEYREKFKMSEIENDFMDWFTLWTNQEVKAVS